jgi:hypothetical protein
MTQMLTTRKAPGAVVRKPAAPPQAQTFGDYNPVIAALHRLDLTIYPYAAGLSWGAAGQTANYIGDYFGALLPPGTASAARQELSGSLSFVANELLENAVKFHYNSFLPVTCCVQQGETEICLQVANSVNPLKLPKFFRLIRELLRHDPAELFMLHMENNFEVLGDSKSGLGLITILNDYGGKLGWHFESLAGLPGLPKQITVTTLARLPARFNQTEGERSKE